MNRLTGSQPKQTELVEQILQASGWRTRVTGRRTLALRGRSGAEPHRQPIPDDADGLVLARHHASARRRLRQQPLLDAARGRHPLMQSHPELDPDRFIDAVAAAKGDEACAGREAASEWQALFEWCAQRVYRIQHREIIQCMWVY